MGRLATLVLLILSLILPSPAAAVGWRPDPDSTWQVQFSGRIDTTIRAEVFDLDAFDTRPRMIRALHARGRHVICYINAGAWESWRPDSDRFPAALLGRDLDGWPSERWLDIRRIDVLGPILRQRLAMCRAKGFNGVEFDNVDGYSNRTGFALTAADQLVFDRWLASAAHEQGLAVGLKNTLGLAQELAPMFDFAILEQCFFYRECELAAPFVDSGKAVLDIEYEIGRNRFCSQAGALGISAMRKRPTLSSWRRSC